MTLLRLLDCLTWDRQSPDEEQVYYTNYKNETTKAIKEIANKSMDLRVIKMAASVLGASVRAWPVDCKDAKDLQNKFLVLAEANTALLFGSGSEDKISMLKKSFKFPIDIVLPRKHGSKANQKDGADEINYKWSLPSESQENQPLKVEDFLTNDDQVDDENAKKTNEDDVLACANELLQSTSATSSGAEDQDKDQIKDKKS